MAYHFEFKRESAQDRNYDTSEQTPALKRRCGALAQAAVTATAESRLQEIPQAELGAVVRELRSRGISVEITSPNQEDAIIEFSE